MKKVLFIVSLIIIIINSCSEGITEPQPGRRDYVWSVDTLRAEDFGYQSLSDIWGSSPKDIWVVGDAALPANKIWHYNGNNWKNYVLDQFIAPIRIHGISSYEIWMVTITSEIWKYNGVSWQKDTTIIPEGYIRILFEDIYGYENNLYAVGIAEKKDGDFTGIIVHYNGKRWKILDIPKISEYFIRVMFLEKGDILITAINFYDSVEPKRLYKYANNEIKIVSKSNSGYSLGIINNKLLVNHQKKIYEYYNGSLILKLDLSNTNYGAWILGRSMSDFFTVNYNWNIGHYNGIDLTDIYYINGYLIDGVVFDKDVFFVCNDFNGLYYVLHGQLK